MQKSLAEQLAEVRGGIPVKGQAESSETQGTAAVRGPNLSSSRPLTAEERKFIAHLLRQAEPDATAFLPQLEGMRAKSSCTCGCPTISLVVMPEQPSVEHPNHIVADMTGVVGNCGVGIILFRRDGKLAELEVYAFGDLPSPFGLPATSTVRNFG